MRRIEQEMMGAIFGRYDFDKSNTNVRIYDDHAAVYLHGNHIGDYVYDDIKFKVNKTTLERWPSRTTLSRLWALGVDVCQRKGRIILEGEDYCEGS